MTLRNRNVLVLGASGFLGANVTRALVGQDRYSVTLHTRRENFPAPQGRACIVRADLGSLEQVSRLLDESSPDLVINCSALADVDSCEHDPHLADVMNHRLPGFVADWSSRHGARFVHVSTDSVFDGLGGSYDETSPTSPVNQYGLSKRNGEEAVRASDPNALVIRTNIVGWSPTGTRSLLEYFHSRLARREKVSGFVDVFFRPLPVHWFWSTVERFLTAGSTGVVHVTGPEFLSKAAFGQRVAVVFDFDPDLVVSTRSDIDPARVARPPRLDVIPSTLEGDPVLPGGLDQGLIELQRMYTADQGLR